MHIVATLVASFIVVYFSLLCFQNPLLKKSDWTSDIWIVEVSNKGLLLLWLVYFIVRLVRVADEGIFDNLEQRALAVLNYLKTVIGVSSFWRPVDVLLGLTVTWGIYNLFYIFIKKQTQYDSLWLKDFPEYNFPFQQNLVTFLNEKPRFGHNIYWLDGEWGTGKTHFLRTFFKEQKYKKLELYYVSCFGITSRDQAEQVLIREIEERSSLGSLDNIPIINSLVKWGFKTLGLDLMKKDSVVIFDDLERVSYNVKAQDTQSDNATKKSNEESKDKGNDNPQDYNDLLGFIDYLANHKNQKVIVVYNSKDISETQKNIIENKFSPVSHKMPSTGKIIENIIQNENAQDEFIGQFFTLFYQIKIDNLDQINFRELIRDIYDFKQIEQSESETKNFIVNYLDQLVKIRYLHLVLLMVSGIRSEKLSGVSPYDICEYQLISNKEEADEKDLEYLRAYELSEKIWSSYCEILVLLKESEFLSDLVFKSETDKSDSNMLHIFDLGKPKEFEQTSKEILFDNYTLRHF